MVPAHHSCSLSIASSATLGLTALQSQHSAAVREFTALSMSLQDTTVPVGYPRTYATLLPQAMLSVLCLQWDLPDPLPPTLGWSSSLRQPRYGNVLLTAARRGNGGMTSMPRNKGCTEPHGPSRKSPPGVKCAQFPYILSQPLAILMQEDTV